MQLVGGIKGRAAPDVVFSIVTGVKTIAAPHYKSAARVHSGLDPGRRLSGGFIMERVEALSRMETIHHPDVAAVRILILSALVMEEIRDVIASYNLAHGITAEVRGCLATFEPNLGR